MSTIFLVVGKKGTKLDKKTKASLQGLVTKEDEILFKETDDEEQYHQLKPTKGYDYVCLIPNGAEVNTDFVKILAGYKEDREEEIIYMPLVVLNSGKTKGILNSCVWNTNMAEEVGVLTPDLAKQQIDTTLYGCVIPFKLFFDEENYKPGLKFYQHFYFLNKVTSNENNLVFGVPKTLVYTDIDLSYTGISNEEKVKYFKEAKEIAPQEVATA